jgi:hypothetical protein
MSVFNKNRYLLVSVAFGLVLVAMNSTPDQVARIENYHGKDRNDDTAAAATDFSYRVLKIPGKYMGTLKAKNLSMLKDVDL